MGHSPIVELLLDVGHADPNTVNGVSHGQYSPTSASLSLFIFLCYILLTHPFQICFVFVCRRTGLH